MDAVLGLVTQQNMVVLEAVLGFVVILWAARPRR